MDEFEGFDFYLNKEEWELPPEHERSGFMREALDLTVASCIRNALAYCAIENPQPEAAIDYLVPALNKIREGED